MNDIFFSTKIIKERIKTPCVLESGDPNKRTLIRGINGNLMSVTIYYGNVGYEEEMDLTLYGLALDDLSFLLDTFVSDMSDCLLTTK